MKRLLAIFLLLLPLDVPAHSVTKPKLVLVIVADQFRYDYLTRYRSDYKEGLQLLLNKGAVFTDARLEQFPTVTAAAHSTILTGATSSISGIVGNDWFDRRLGKIITAISDDSVIPLGGGSGASPHRLLVSTVGDEMKMADHNSRVIGISLKARGAILPVGHMADGAYWFDEQTGNFVSSSYYFADLPPWVKEFDLSRPADRYKGAKWLDNVLPKEKGDLYRALSISPFGNELMEEFVERAVDADQLGRHGEPDLLSLSFSANDYVGHTFGPDSPEVHEMCLRTDQLLGRLFKFLDARVGMKDVLVVFTADHGVAPIPEVNLQRKMPGGRLSRSALNAAIQDSLEKRYGPGKWIAALSEDSLYLNSDLIQSKNLNRAEVNLVAAQAVMELPHVFRVYTREQLISGSVAGDYIGRRVLNGFYMPRSGDLYILLEPYWLLSTSSKGTTHSTTFGYDSHVPIIFLGEGIKTGEFYRAVAVNDIAPTLSAILDVETPSGSVGRILSEIFTNNEPKSRVAQKTGNR